MNMLYSKLSLIFMLFLPLQFDNYLFNRVLQVHGTAILNFLGFLIAFFFILDRYILQIISSL